MRNDVNTLIVSCILITCGTIFVLIYAGWGQFKQIVRSLEREGYFDWLTGEKTVPEGT